MNTLSSPSTLDDPVTFHEHCCGFNMAVALIWLCQCGVSCSMATVAMENAVMFFFVCVCV